jgi:hypothetical protein
MENALENFSKIHSERALGKIIEENVIKKIPGVDLLVGIGGFFNGYSDYSLILKITELIKEIEDIPNEEREKIIREIELDSKNTSFFGDKILFILDKCDDLIDANLLGQLLASFFKMEITFSEFTRGAKIINTIFFEDLKRFFSLDEKYLNKTGLMEEIPYEEDLPLINAGLLGFGYESPSFQFNGTDDNKMAKGAIYITSIGETLRKVLDLSKVHKL